MTVDDLDLALAPVIEALEVQNDLLTDVHELLSHISDVQAGVILFLGVIAGILLIYILLRRF